LLVFGEVVGKARQICCGGGRKPGPWSGRFRVPTEGPSSGVHSKPSGALEEIEMRCYEDLIF